MNTVRRNIRRIFTGAAAVLSALQLAACAGLSGDPQETVYSSPELKEKFQQERFAVQSANLNTLSFDMAGTGSENTRKFSVLMRRDPAAVRIEAEGKEGRMTLLKCGNAIFVKDAKGAWREAGGRQLTGALQLLYNRFFTPLDLPVKVIGNAKKDGGMIWALDLRDIGVYTETLILETDKDGNIIRRKELLASGRSMKNFEYRDFQTVSGYVMPMTLVMTHNPESRNPARIEFKISNCKVNAPVPAGLLDRPAIKAPAEKPATPAADKTKSKNEPNATK